MPLKLHWHVPLDVTLANTAVTSSGMCHLISQRYLPEWREEDERAFVHRGSWVSKKGLDNTMPATVNCICKKSL